ncbi:tRNA pseudouridine(55) synthase TruB [Stenoxybacter acetivorans]|uniref:tRNA pseudouridine(55) synthase TruB n=1 Tax=Stenoxybacter acetivorans TaxID=422441 RepID=UPI000568521F|nr:tRNA pseudouridine(55) synthase TruB [Stenoxybacter acetivorans]
MLSSTKLPRRKLSGVLLLDKACGVSSNTALQQVRRLYRAEKAGHTGVLDPLATGLLPVCFGEATKFAQYLLDADKAYEAVLKLGQATNTGDAEGEIIADVPVNVRETAFQAACAVFIGVIKQTPPMYSALKHQGKPLYAYARAGVEIERKVREICIHRIDITRFEPPEAGIIVHCSKGTYIRTLAEDLAKHAGTVAHLTALRRTQTAGFLISQSHTLSALSALSEAERDALLLPCDVLVQHLPAVRLAENEITRLQHGLTTRAIPMQHTENHGIISPLRVYGEDNRFIGLVSREPQTGCLKALRLMSTAAA